MNTESEICDVLVLGGGIAGYRSAVAASEAGLKVTLLDKTEGNCSVGIVGYNVASRNAPSGDSPAKYFDDLMKGGGFLNNPKLAAVIGQVASRVVFNPSLVGGDAYVKN